jgi:hypothetical protein
VPNTTGYAHGAPRHTASLVALRLGGRCHLTGPIKRCRDVDSRGAELGLLDDADEGPATARVTLR